MAGDEKPDHSPGPWDFTSGGDAPAPSAERADAWNDLSVPLVGVIGPSIPQRAARFCCRTPLYWLGLNLCSCVVLRPWRLDTESPLALVIAFLGLLLILAGIMMGVMALFGIRSHGIRGILGPAMLGLALNGLLLAAYVSIFVLASKGQLPTPDDLAIYNRIEGTWRERQSNLELQLRKDGTFRYRVFTRGIVVADFSGKWSVQRKHLYLRVEEIIDGKKDLIGSGIRWSIDHLGDNELVLGAVNGQDRYIRQ